MERWFKEDALDGSVSELWFGLWVASSVSSLCGRLAELFSSTDVVEPLASAVLSGTFIGALLLSFLGRQAASAREEHAFLDFKVSKEGEEEYGQPGQVQA